VKVSAGAPTTSSTGIGISSRTRISVIINLFVIPGIA
jgi:hypothetical protein